MTLFALVAKGWNNVKQRHYLTNVNPLAKLADCSRCGEAIEIWSAGNKIDGKRYRCKESMRVRRYSENKQHYEANRQIINRKAKLKEYGMTIEDYDYILGLQDGKCAICFRPREDFARDLHVDHDHDTGQVRGLLCGNCNTSLGGFKDNVEILESAIKYLST